MAELKRFIGIAAAGKALSRQEAVEAFDIMMSGQATPAQIGALLMALRVRGENIDEIAGAVSAMRSKMLKVSTLQQCDRHRWDRRRSIRLI